MPHLKFWGLFQEWVNLVSMALYLYGSNEFGIGEPAKILTVIRKGFLWLREFYYFTCEKILFDFPKSSLNSLGLWCRTKEVLSQEGYEKEVERYFCPGLTGSYRTDYIFITFISFRRVFKSCIKILFLYKLCSQWPEISLFISPQR